MVHRMTSQNTPENRYARQRQFAPIGVEGQRRIESAGVAVLGCGALGTVAAEILTRAGVGRLKLIDRDVVEWTNLQRQSLFVEDDAIQGVSKADVARRRLHRINSSIDLSAEVIDVTADNIDGTLDGMDLVIDACDNFSLRLLLNDWSLQTRTAWVHGGCVGAAGQVRLFDGQGTPCFRCLVSEVPPPGAVQTCDTAGVVGAATHAIASLQAGEAIKWLSGNRDAVRRSVLSLDFWQNRIREITISETLSKTCRACHDRQYDFLEGRKEAADQTFALCGRDSVQVAGMGNVRLDLQAIARRWPGVGAVQETAFFIRLHFDETTSLTLFRDGRAVIAGTQQISEARSLYDRYVG